MKAGQAARARGFTLIEVLVALLIAAVGLLGMAALHLSGLRAVETAYLRSQATLAANDLLERMRANADAARAGNYVAAYGAVTSAGTDCEATSCTGAQMAAFDLARWKTTLAGLPSGDGKVEQVGTRITVTVRWDNSRSGDATQWASFLMTTDF